MLLDVQQRIKAACLEAGRDPLSVTLIDVEVLALTVPVTGVTASHLAAATECNALAKRRCVSALCRFM